MKGKREALRPLQFFFVTIMALLLPLQTLAHAYKPPNTAQILPEAVTGSFYCVQLFAEDTGKKFRWSAEGLPEGLEIDPAKGIIFGTAKSPGVFEFLVTAQSGWKWRPRIDIMRYRISVLPQPVQAPAAQPVPTAPPPDSQQSGAEPTVTLAAPGPRAGSIEWLFLWANGASGLETTTGLYLQFSGDLPIGLDDYADFIWIDANAAKTTGFSKASDMEHTYILGIDEIDESIRNGGEITVKMMGIPGMVLYEISDSVQLHFADRPNDADKVALVLGGIIPDSLLGANQSADEITSDLTLPLTNAVYHCAVLWQSSDEGVISNSGGVTRPPHSENDKQVTLTAAVQIGVESGSRDFAFTVKAQPKPDPLPEALPEILPDIAPPKNTQTESKPVNVSAETQTSANVDGSGALSRASVVNELKAALQDAVKGMAVIKTKNAVSVSPKTLKALADAAKAEGKQAVLHADTMTQNRKVDARLYLNPESLAGITEPVKLGIATKGQRPETIKGFFEKYFDNKVSVISCEQQGSFGAKLQIAAKIKLPEETANLVFYSYNAESNTFSRIFTAYRIDANGYLRFASEAAGDIVVSSGVLKRR